MHSTELEKYGYFLNFHTIPDALTLYADSGKTAVVSGGESITYRELISGAQKLALALRSEGVKRGDRVLLALERSTSSIVALLGILYAGAAYIAVQRSWPKERLDYICKDSNADFLLDEQALERLQRKCCEGALPQLRGEDEFAVYYTSGSTGVPKGCVTHHQTFFHFAVPVRQNTYASEIMEHCERCASMINFAYIGSIWDISITLLCGKTLVLATEAERMNSTLLARRIYEERCDALNMPPSQLLSYSMDPSFRNGIRNVRCFAMGGEALTQTALRWLRELSDGRFFLVYGASEIGAVAEASLTFQKPVSIGNPVYGAKLYLLDSAGHPVAEGDEGEICVGGIPAALGYYIGNDALTARKYSESGELGRIYHTGDRGIVCEDGTIRLIGRMDNMKKLHAQRIELQEIEQCLEGFPGIQRAAADIRGDEPDAKLLAWYIAEKPLAAEQIRAYLKQKLPAYMIPARMKQVEAFPLNQNGKLDRSVLPDAPSEEMQTHKVGEGRNCVLRLEGTVSRVWSKEAVQEKANRLFAGKERSVFFKDVSALPEGARERFVNGFWQVLEEDAPLSMAFLILSEGRSRLLVRIDRQLWEEPSQEAFLPALAAEYEIERESIRWIR